MEMRNGMIKISGEFEVKYELEFNHKFNIFHTRSAEGKSYLFRDIIGDDTTNSYSYLSASNLGTVNSIIGRELKQGEIIILDDFEVICERYPKVLQTILRHDDICVICSLKKLHKCEEALLQDCGFYCLRLNQDTLVAKELWTC